MAFSLARTAGTLPWQKQRTPLVKLLQTKPDGVARNDAAASQLHQFVKAQVTDLTTTVEAVCRQGISAFQKIQTALGFKPAADLRAQQLQEMATEPVELSPAEQWVNRYFKETSILLGTTAASLLIYPPLIYLNVPFIAYNSIPFWKRAYEDLVHRKQVTTTVVDATLSLGAISFAPFHPQVLVVGALGTWLFALTRKLVIKAEGRTRSELTNLFGRQPRSVWVYKDGVEIEVPFTSVQAGDLVIVDAGHMIPVDGVIAEGMASIDQRALTGEAQPAEKTVGDVVFAATIVLAGKIFIRVEKTGAETAAAQIGQILNSTSNFTSSVQLRGQAISDRSALPTLLLSGLALPLAGPNASLAVLFSGLGYTMKILGPLSVLNFLQVTSHHGILIKDGRALEQLSKVDTIVFDKTGTLTLDQPHVGAIYTCYNYTPDLLLTLAAAAEHRQSHPVARAILHAAQEKALMLPAIHDAAYEVGYGIQVTWNEDVIRVGSHRYMTMSAISIPAEFEILREKAHVQGYSLVYVAVNDRLAGALELHPTVRPEAKRIVAGLRAAGLDLYIISGDQTGPTRALAEQLGIEHFFAETLPEHKADHIARLQEQGRFVCFIGDGINDSIALKKAQVSISLRGASTIATDTAQIILMDQTLNQLETLFTLSQKFESNMRWNFMSSTVPGTVIIGGALVGVVNFGASITLFYLGLGAGLVNAMLPLFLEQKEKE